MLWEEGQGRVAATLSCKNMIWDIWHALQAPSRVSAPLNSILTVVRDCQADWRDRNSNEPPPLIRPRPESLWKMSYGYFWRTKRSLSPQGKPWIAGLELLEKRDWLMHLALVVERAAFVPGATDLHLRRTSKRSRVFTQACVRRPEKRREERRSLTMSP